MTRKLFLRLDQSTLPTQDFAAIVGASNVSNVDPIENYYQYSFESIALDHALLLFGSNKSRFGFDLFHYLHSAQGFFGQTSDGMVVMPDSGPDFKRRYSEDLGVAIGILLMTDTIGLRIDSVTHIPISRQLDKHAKTPDFVGFDMQGAKRVFECKGTTAPQDVDKHRQKAKDQLAEHKEADVTKFAMVTYVPTSSKLIPPFIFVSDPPIPLPMISPSLAIGLHYVLAFEFAGLTQLADSLRQILIERLKDNLIAEGLRTRYPTRFETAADSFFRKGVTYLLEHRSKMDFLGNQFVGTWRSVQHQQRKFWAYTGIGADRILTLQEKLLESTDPDAAVFEIPPFTLNREVDRNAERIYDTFPDGTLLLISSQEPTG